MATGPGNDKFGDYIRAQAKKKAGSGAKSKSGGKVYIGKVHVSVPGVLRPGVYSPSMLHQDSKIMQKITHRKPHNKAAYMSTSEAENQFYHWDDQQVSKFRNALEVAGINVSKMDRQHLASRWAGLVRTSEKYTAAGKHISPWDVLNGNIRAAKKGGYSGVGGGAGGGGSGGSGGSLAGLPKEITKTSSAINYTDPNTARSIVNQTMQQMLGRNPTNAEIKKFTDALHSYEKSNPQVSKQQIDTATGMVVADKSVNKQITQAGAAQMAQDETMKKKEYGSYQAATTYFNALRSMVNSGGPSGGSSGG